MMKVKWQYIGIGKLKNWAKELEIDKITESYFQEEKSKKFYAPIEEFYAICILKRLSSIKYKPRVTSQGTNFSDISDKDRMDNLSEELKKFWEISEEYYDDKLDFNKKRKQLIETTDKLNKNLKDIFEKRRS